MQSTGFFDLWRQFREMLNKLDQFNLSISDLLEIGSKLYELTVLPDWLDPASVQKWAKRVVDTLDYLANLTITEFDDQLVSALRFVVDDENGFIAIYSLLVDLFDGEDIQPDVSDSRVLACSDKAKVDPTIIILIIEAAIQIFKWWRERRGEA